MFLRNITLQKSCIILGQVLCTYQGKIKSCCSFDFCNLSINQLMRPSKNFVLPYIYPVYLRRICVFTACDVHIYISQSVLPSWSHGLSHVPYIRSIFANLSYSTVKAEHPVWRKALWKRAPSSSQNTYIKFPCGSLWEELDHHTVVIVVPDCYLQSCLWYFRLNGYIYKIQF